MYIRCLKIFSRYDRNFFSKNSKIKNKGGKNSKYNQKIEEPKTGNQMK